MQTFERKIFEVRATRDGREWTVPVMLDQCVEFEGRYYMQLYGRVISLEKYAPIDAVYHAVELLTKG